MQKLTVELADRSYPIFIGDGILGDFSGLLNASLGNLAHAIIVFDENIASIAKQVESQFASCGTRVSSISIPSGETSKSVTSIERIWEFMLAEHTDRKSCVIAVGGGVVGDLAGFAAASFARGIPLVQVPTTLLSQVDSSVGGKTAINLPGAKNIVGAFWQPSMVLIDSETLRSLPKREYVSGLAEVVKYGVILMPDLMAYLESHATELLALDPESVGHIVRVSCEAKAQVVAEDERETSGRRAILNYGHTFAHAIENVAGYGEFLHGEAVSMGMHMAALLSKHLGRVDEAFVQRQESLLKTLGLPTAYENDDAEELWKAMQHDKKVESGKLRFILPRELGAVELVDDISREQAIAAIEAAGS
ncbi:MAG: 3-dehydroquinate synthase [Pirellulaceae bacterium]